MGTGPLVNPFPLDRSRRAAWAHAHRDPMEPWQHERSGLYRPVVPSPDPAQRPDEEFNAIFAALGSHRDRALVAFYVSTGARASELLSATRMKPPNAPSRSGTRIPGRLSNMGQPDQ